MSARGKVWAIGLFLTVAVGGSLAWDRSTRELSIPVVLVSLASLALVAEGVALRSSAKGRDGAVPPEGARPADGVVEVVPIDGVDGQVNADSPRFRRFVGLLEGRPGDRKARGLSPGNPRLLGRAVLISVFVGRDGAGWSDEEIARGLEAMERAGRWIEREAIRRGAMVNVGLAEAYFRVEDDEADPVEVAFAPEGDDVGPMEAHASTKSIIAASRAAASLGFADVADLLGRINGRVEADARVWVFHVRRAGRSLAIPAADCEVSGVGLAVCFSREASFPEPLIGPARVDATTVAHELLHLFGASDKYGVPLRSFAPGSVTSSDIMRLNHDSLPRMTIDPLTASEIGWRGAVSSRPAKRNARRRPSRKAGGGR